MYVIHTRKELEGKGQHIRVIYRHTRTFSGTAFISHSQYCIVNVYVYYNIAQYTKKDKHSASVGTNRKYHKRTEEAPNKIKEGQRR